MTRAALDVVVIGLSITSSWGNGHATTWRSLLRALHGRGHTLRFLERDMPWYAVHRDAPAPAYCRTNLYDSVAELRGVWHDAVRDADLVIIGSFVPDGIEVADWALRTARGAVAFYDIDTPVTVASVLRGECLYMSRELVPRFDAYLSFTGGPMLRRIVDELGARRALPLYCSVDADHYRPNDAEPRWDLGYMGTYSADRQPTLDGLLVEPARAATSRIFVVAGPQYPHGIEWPDNVRRVEHVAPDAHCDFYNSQRFTLNITRNDMVSAGHSPSVRLFEAAACGVPVVSDSWPGLAELFVPGEEILLAATARDVIDILDGLGDDERRAIGARARDRVLAAHTAEHRASELEAFATALLAGRAVAC